MPLLLCLWLSFSSLALESSPSYTDTNSVQALRFLQAAAGKNPKHLTDPELAEWVRARFALIALLRLEGKNAEAIEAFENCGKLCAKHGPSGEWKALKVWGCLKKKNADPCRGK